MPRTQGLQGAYINRQYELFSWLEPRLGSLPERYQTLILIFEMICVEDYITRPIRSRLGGRPQCSRCNLARAFIAKMLFNIPTTSESGCSPTRCFAPSVVGPVI